MKVYLEPFFEGADEGDGGVRRVLEALRRHLPVLGVEFVGQPEDADIIHCHITPTDEVERYLKSHPQALYVVSNHGFYWADHEWDGNWYQRANASCMEAVRQADHVIAPSEWVAQSIRRNSLRPVTPIGHGVDFADWSSPATKEAMVLWNKTRPDPVCDPEPVMRLAQIFPKVKFVSTFGEEAPNVELTGRLPYEEAKALVERAGIYLCTAQETFGIGTLEAMATGAAVLGWAWGGQVEIIEHKKTGWLSPPGDYDHLAEGLEWCLSNRTQVGLSARKEVEKNYQWGDVVQKYVAVYEGLMKQAKAREGQPRVSIVVPAYGLEDFLTSTLDSVQAQTSADWECVVVDDASLDHCGEIADRYAARDDRFRVIHNEKNQYLSGALNIGIAAAKGRYILPLDADNMLPETAVEVLAGELDQDRTMHIAYGNVEFLEPDGKRWHSGWPPEFRGEWQTSYSEGNRPPNLIPSGSMYRRQVWEQTGGYRRRWRTAEDADFWTRATSYGYRAKKMTEADVLVYRNREDSMSRVQGEPDWSPWYPWMRNKAIIAPAAIIKEEQAPIPSLQPVIISVIIPVGPGHEEYVVDAVDSVDAQTFRLFEVIVVNDTGRPLKARLPNWARVISTSPRKKGVAVARNLGISRAQGRFFVPLDADDTLDPLALAEMYRAWQQVHGYIYPDFWQLWGDGKIDHWETENYDAHKLLEKGCIHAVTGLYTIADWKRVGGFDETLPAWEDWDFQLKLAEIGVCGSRLPVPLFTYRKDTGMRREENYA